MPAVKPVVTGCGTNWISRPRPAIPINTRSTPAIIEAISSPARPKRAAIGDKITTKAAVGPDTLAREPPNNAVSPPATIAVYRPCCGGAPQAIARAIESGKATIPTTSPAAMSARKSASP